jgi:hypothetical protein
MVGLPKVIPLKMKVVVKKDINREMQGEMGICNIPFVTTSK